MNELPLGTVVTLLILLLLISAFFSGTETALMTVNRYRLRHRARQGHRGARIAESLLRRPDRLITVILMGSNIANALATSLVTAVALEIGGSAGALIASVAIGIAIMVFTDIIPKTLGALRPEQLGLPAAYVYWLLLKVMLPFVWLVAAFSSGLLRLAGVRADEAQEHHLTLEELRTIVAEAGALLPRRRQRMLMAILELEDMTVEEIMIPDNELLGVDVTASSDEILAAIRDCPYPRVPVFRGNVDNLVGLLSLRRLLQVPTDRLTGAALESLVDEPFFVPEGTSLHALLVQLQRAGQRSAFVVDEYGDIQGMVTIEDMLEEILGEFSKSTPEAEPEVRAEDGGRTWVVNAGSNIRDLNRQMGWRLPTEGPTTLNGLILEKLETIPAPGARLELNGYPIEVITTSGAVVKTVRVGARLAAADAQT